MTPSAQDEKAAQASLITFSNIKNDQEKVNKETDQNGDADQDGEHDSLNDKHDQEAEYEEHPPLNGDDNDGEGNEPCSDEQRVQTDHSVFTLDDAELLQQFHKTIQVLIPAFDDLDELAERALLRTLLLGTDPEEGTIQQLQGLTAGIVNSFDDMAQKYREVYQQLQDPQMKL